MHTLLPDFKAIVLDMPVLMGGNLIPHLRLQLLLSNSLPQTFRLGGVFFQSSLHTAKVNFIDIDRSMLTWPAERFFSRTFFLTLTLKS